jgi:presenilin-like A22 family membrane protease
MGDMAGLKDNLKAAYPVAVTLLMVWVFTLIPVEHQPQPIITPIPETGGSVEEAILDPAPYFNTLIVIAVMTVGGVVVVVLLRRPSILKILGTILIAITAYSTTTYHLLILTQTPLWAILIMAGLVTSWVIVAVLRIGGWLAVLASAYVGSSAGAIIGESIPYWTAIILILAASGYDLLAVSIGPLKALGRPDVGSIPGFMVDFAGMSIGMGDLFFYSITQSFTLTRLGVLPGFFAALGVFTGFLVTAHLASKRKIVAGLPIPLPLSLALAFLATLLH